MSGYSTRRPRMAGEKKPEPLIVFYVRLPRDLRRRVKEWAKVRGYTLQAVVAHALEAYVGKR